MFYYNCSNKVIQYILKKPSLDEAELCSKYLEIVCDTRVVLGREQKEPFKDD